MAKDGRLTTERGEERESEQWTGQKTATYRATDSWRDREGMIDGATVWVTDKARRAVGQKQGERHRRTECERLHNELGY